MPRRNSLLERLAGLLAVSSCVSAYPKTGGNAAIPPGQNPFGGIGWYIDPEYTLKVNQSTTLLRLYDRNTADLATMAGDSPTIVYLSSSLHVTTRLATTLLDARLANLNRNDPFGPNTVTYYLYNIPGRDCAQKDFPGEFPATSVGLTAYKGWIDAVRRTVDLFPDVRVVGVLEPDAVVNMAVNAGSSSSACGIAKPFQLQALQYAVKTLQSKNMALYIDVGNARANAGSSAQDATVKTVQSILSATAPATVRGFMTNRHQYVPLKYSLGTYPMDGTPDALTFTSSLASRLSKLSLPTHFLIDTSRNGVALPTVLQWCNVRGSGMGFRPTDLTDQPFVDAYVWTQVGESDGTDNFLSANYDKTCASFWSLRPSPEEGMWFHNLFVQLVKNANPSLDAGKPWWMWWA